MQTYTSHVRHAGIVLSAGAFFLLFTSTATLFSYVLLGAEWSGSSATFRVNANFPSADGGSDAQQLEAVRCGADAWHLQGQTPFDFVYLGTTGVTTIDPFDSTNAVFHTGVSGGGSVLAVTVWGTDIFDNFAGFDIVFYGENDFGEIPWNGVGDPEDDEYDIGAVATHEFGHALGLGHSTDGDATMYGFYNGIVGRTLHADDIDGVQAIYDDDPDIDSAPAIDEVDPDEGEPEGGNEVVIHGSGFTWESDTTLYIDGEEIDRDDWDLESCATLRILSMPVHDSGDVSIEIVNELGSVLMDEAYTYLGEPPAVTGSAPSGGPVDGGTAVTVLGVNFTEDAVVRFGGKLLLDQEFVNSNRITGTVPSGSGAGSVDVKVDQASGEFTAEDEYLYTEDRLEMGSGTFPPGSPGAEIEVLASNDFDVDGVSFGVDFDGELLEIADVVEGEETEDAAFFGVIMNNDLGPDGGWFTLGILMDLSPPLDEVLEAGEGNRIARAIFDVRADAPLGSESDLTIIGGLGDPPVTVRFIFDSREVEPTIASGSLTVDAVPFIRGDADGNTLLLINDAIIVLAYMFQDGTLACEDRGDIDDNGQLLINDPIALLAFMFSNGAPPAEPFPEEGNDPTADSLQCE